MADTIQPFSKSITLTNESANVSCNILAEAAQLTIMSGAVPTEFYCAEFNVKTGIVDGAETVEVMPRLASVQSNMSNRTGDIANTETDYFQREVDAISAVFSTPADPNDSESTLNKVLSNHTTAVDTIDTAKDTMTTGKRSAITDYIATENDSSDGSESTIRLLEAQLESKSGVVSEQTDVRTGAIGEITNELDGHVDTLTASLTASATELGLKALKAAENAEARDTVFTNAENALNLYCGSENDAEGANTDSQLAMFKVDIATILSNWKGTVDDKKDALLADIEALQSSLNTIWNGLSLGGKSISTLKDVKECTLAANIDVNTQVRVLDEGVSTMWKDMQDLSAKFYDMIDASCGKSSQFTAEYPQITTESPDLPVDYGNNTHKIVEIQDDHTLKLSDLAGLETYQSTDPAVPLTPYTSASFTDKELFIGGAQYSFQAVNGAGIQLLDANDNTPILLSTTSVTTGQFVQFVVKGDNTHRVLTIGGDAVTMALFDIETRQNIANGTYSSFGGKTLKIDGVEQPFVIVDKGIQVLDAAGGNVLRASDVNVAAGQLIRFADVAAPDTNNTYKVSEISLSDNIFKLKAGDTPLSHDGYTALINNVLSINGTHYPHRLEQDNAGLYIGIRLLSDGNTNATLSADQYTFTVDQEIVFTPSPAD